MEAPKSGTEAMDEHKLAEMGYRQDLQRDWSMLHNFGVSFSIIVCPCSRNGIEARSTLTMSTECYHRSHDVCVSLRPLPLAFQ